MEGGNDDVVCERKKERIGPKSLQERIFTPPFDAHKCAFYFDPS